VVEAVSALYFLVIPAQERHYLEPDLRLLKNRSHSLKSIDERYAAAYFWDDDKKKPMLYDLSTEKIIMPDNIHGLDKVPNFKTGDTVTITFRKGLLGYKFDPRVK